MPFRRSLSRWVSAVAILGSLAVVAYYVIATPASAATVTPVSATNCNGSLKKAPTTSEPNALAYKFRCDGAISAYTVVANRGINHASNIDDFSPNALIYASGSPVSTVSFNCEGSLPGNGINCNAGGKSMPAFDYAEGTFDPTAPYCPVSTAGSGAKHGQQALVQLIVTDATGAEDGPFRLNLSSGCRSSHAGKGAGKHKSRHSGNRRERRRS